MSIKLTIEIISPILAEDHVVLRNTTMALLSLANDEIGGMVHTPTDEAEEPEEEPVPPAAGGLN